MENLSSKDRAFTDITNGSIHLWFHCYTLNGLLDLWEMYKSGKFLHLLQECLIKPDIKQKFHPKIRVRIIDEEFQQCYQELSGQSFEGNKDVTEDRKAVQKSPISAKVKERITPQIIQPTGIKILKQKNSLQTFIQICEKMSDQPKEIPGSQLTKQNLRKSKSDPLPSMSGCKVPFEKSSKKFPNKNISQLASVVDESTDSNSEKMMSEEHKKLVKDNRVKLVQNMIANDVLDHLLQKDVLTMSEKDRIKAEGASMNEKLIDTIMCKQDKAFFVFVDALKNTGQPHLADLLSPAKKRKPASGRENANAKRMVIQSNQSSILPKTVTPTSVKVELQSEGEIYNAGSKNILINEPREDNPLISKYDQLPSTSAYVEASAESIESLPNEAFSQTGSVDESTDGEDSDSVKMMSEEHKKLVKDNRVKLVQNMIANDVLDHLLQKDVLTMSEKDRIKAEGASMNKKLIDTIMCKQDKAFFVFVDALKNTGQPHLADLLSPAKKRKPGTRCCRYLPQKRAGPRRVGTLKGEYSIFEGESLHTFRVESGQEGQTLSIKVLKKAEYLM
ncbi:uncharacterized protein LOC115223936 isoform X8 [Octopus sinensis]|uniref:Uncharacterized protein LOC115223936 isoform X8 n=1 Tax=Octopus sinensis TaxID=2607531 RepID=A0A6P7TGI1_9MOLL|nr:uncharacterized protein LOC115223936 isoform X8 [Octopus sinensis]